ncbi:MAG TPA: protein kinase, partial [Gemmataceae bacterium]
MTQTLCPGGRRLQARREEGEAGDEADELVHHLESCSACQETLQDLAAPPHLWVCAAWGLTDKARAEPALHRLVWRLKEEDPLPAEDGGPSFLRPTDKPGLLGLLGRYEVQEEIGRGGMGLVLKALDPDLNRIVAIKLLSPHLASNATARLRFVREAKATAAVCHDHVVTVHGVDATDGLPYLVMQYVDGESLQARL